MFQGVRQGSVLYILKKGEQPQLSTAQVVSVSNPYPSPKAPNIFGQQNSVVDIQAGQRKHGVQGNAGSRRIYGKS